MNGLLPIVPSIGLGGCLSIGQERNTCMAYWPIALPLKLRALLH